MLSSDLILCEPTLCTAPFLQFLSIINGSSQNSCIIVKGLQDSNYMYGYEYFNTLLTLIVRQPLIIGIIDMQLERESRDSRERQRIAMPVLQQKLGRMVTPLREGEYNAIEDKYAFGYFQNTSVQRHLLKLLKVQSPQNSYQNIKNLPPSAQNRKIINTLTEKVNPKHQSQPIKSERLTTVQTGKVFSVVRRKQRSISERQFDALYPYKENLKLKSLEKLKASIEKREKLLRKAQEKEINLPRLRTLNDERTMQNYHESTMRKLIEREDKRMASKILVINRLKHREFVSHLSKRSQHSQRELQSNATLPYTIDA